jgi:hypothetical protein
MSACFKDTHHGRHHKVAGREPVAFEVPLVSERVGERRQAPLHELQSPWAAQHCPFLIGVEEIDRRDVCDGWLPISMMAGDLAKGIPISAASPRRNGSGHLRRLPSSQSHTMSDSDPRIGAFSGRAPGIPPLSCDAERSARERQGRH